MSARGKLLAIFLLCVSPVLASTALYFLAPPAGGKSYGRLLATQPFTLAARSDWPQTHWVLLQVEAGACDAGCRQRRDALARIRVAQGEAASRLTVLTASPQPPVADQAVGALRADTRGLVPGGLYLIDPHGNQVLFYPPGAEPVRVIRELAKVLKTNNGLG